MPERVRGRLPEEEGRHRSSTGSHKGSRKYSTCMKVARSRLTRENTRLKKTGEKQCGKSRSKEDMEKVLTKERRRGSILGRSATFLEGKVFFQKLKDRRGGNIRKNKNRSTLLGSRSFPSDSNILKSRR